MDPAKFDDAVRRLASGLSRRSVVGGSLGASVASALTSVGMGEEADAKGKGKGKRKGKGGKHNGKGKGGKGNGRGKDNAARDGGDASIERKKGKGGKCSKDKNCLSNNCQGGKQKKRDGKGRCQPSDVGQRCHRDRDCIASAPCVGGICGFAS
jgi:hypothetical protein